MHSTISEIWSRACANLSPHQPTHRCTRNQTHKKNASEQHFAHPQPSSDRCAEAASSHDGWSLPTHFGHRSACGGCSHCPLVPTAVHRVGGAQYQHSQEPDDQKPLQPRFAPDCTTARAFTARAFPTTLGGGVLCLPVPALVPPGPEPEVGGEGLRAHSGDAGRCSD